MNQERVERESRKILQQILDRGKKNGQITFFDDGIVNIPQYVTAWPKMLWILKEAYNNPKGEVAEGDWDCSLTGVLNEGLYNDKSPYAPIAYVTHSVFSGFTHYRKLPSVSKDEEIRKSVKNIAYINVSKFPGKSKSDPSLLREAYDNYKDLLLQQIELFEPDVVIFGGTIDYFRSDLHLEGEYEKKESAWYRVTAGRLYIQAYHPAQRNTADKVLYVNDIVEIIKGYCEKRHPTL